jgi:hypothetical protein
MAAEVLVTPAMETEMLVTESVLVFGLEIWRSRGRVMPGARRPDRLPESANCFRVESSTSWTEA